MQVFESRVQRCHMTLPNLECYEKYVIYFSIMAIYSSYYDNAPLKLTNSVS